MAFITVHVQGRVLRTIANGPDALSKAQLAVACTPRAGFELCQGEMPAEGEALEVFAQDFKTRWLDREATAFLASHEEDEPVTKVEKPSGMHKRVSLVEN